MLNFYFVIKINNSVKQPDSILLSYSNQVENNNA